MKPIVTKKYLKLLIETSRQRVLEVLFKYPDTEFSLSDLAREAGVAKAHIGEILDELSSMGIMQITKLSKIWRIKANLQNWVFIKSKIVYNLNFIYQSGLVEFLNETYGNPKSIVLFGSFRHGEDISNSDIDIAIDKDEFEKYESIRLVNRELIEIEKEIGRNIHIHQYNRKNVDINVFNNIANGIVLSGFLEVKK